MAELLTSLAELLTSVAELIIARLVAFSCWRAPFALHEVAQSE